MHEYHVMEKIVRTAEETAKRSNALKVLKVSLAVGKLTGFEDGSIRLYFETLAKGTILEGSELFIRHIEPKFKCASCDTLFDCKGSNFACTKCGQPGSPTEIGKEFYIEDMEIESP